MLSGLSRIEGTTLRISEPRITQPGGRPHLIFALTACKISSYRGRALGIQNAGQRMPRPCIKVLVGFWEELWNCYVADTAESS
jgi:hypothetical protein